MTSRRPREFRFEALEARQMLSGSAALMPYGELTLKGHFVAGAPTTVAFAGNHQATIFVTPVSVSKTSVVVAVPAFFDPKTGQPVAARAAVFVDQSVGGHAKDTQVLKNLSIARLPRTGLGAGDVLGAVTIAAATVTSVAAGEFALIAQDSAFTPAVRQVATSIAAELNQVGQVIPLAQQQLVELASGGVGSVPLGTFQGQAATLDANQLGVIDRIIAGGIDGAAGSISYGTALVQSLQNLVTGAALAGPSAVVARARQVVAVLGTATGSPVVPAGSVVTGLALGSLSAVVAAAEAEGQVILSLASPSHNTLAPGEVALVDQVLDDPALGQALNAITTGLVPTTPAGQALILAAGLAEGLAAQIDPNVPGSLGSLVVA